MDLRPLRFGEMLDAAFRAYRQRWLPTAWRSLIVMIPAWLIIGLLGIALVDDDENRAAELVLLAAGLPISVNALIMLMVYVAAATIITGWCTGRITCGFIGMAPGADRVELRSGRGRKSTVLGLTLTLLAVTEGTLLLTLATTKLFNEVRVVLALTLPVVWAAGATLAVFLMLALPAATVECLGYGRAIARSFHLVRRGFGRALLMAFSAYLIVVASTQGLSPLTLLLVQASDTNGTLSYVLSLLTVWSGWGVFILPVIPAISVVTYFSARVRREGLDLAAGVRSVGNARTSEAAA